jgi:hypothetical protein
MKRIMIFISVIFIVTNFLSCGLVEPTSSAPAVVQSEEASKANAQTAITSIPVPQVRYFHERETLSRWVDYWDVPERVPCYIYCFVFDKCIGYYVSDGKPISINSFLTPEQQRINADLGEYGGDMLVEAPDLDGTYGHNNEGIRFFTASGVPVEFGGAGASYQYSPFPLPIDVPQLDMHFQKKK